MRLALAAVATRRPRYLRDIALEEFAEHRRQAFQVRDRQLTSAGRTSWHFLSGTDVDHRGRGLLDQIGKVRQVRLRNDCLP
ncbi:hypothetical protein D9M68_719230 [compost metagenome]